MDPDINRYLQSLDALAGTGKYYKSTLNRKQTAGNFLTLIYP
jgi:hypothetical protein